MSVRVHCDECKTAWFEAAPAGLSRRGMMMGADEPPQGWTKIQRIGIRPARAFTKIPGTNFDVPEMLAQHLPEMPEHREWSAEFVICAACAEKRVAGLDIKFDDAGPMGGGVATVVSAP